MWSKKPTPVDTSACPEPSRFSESVDVGLGGLARIVAVRGITGLP